MYPCLMLRIQRFSSIWKHYARVHQLNAEDLEYYYKEVALDDPKMTTDTINFIDFYKDDTITVRHKQTESRK